MDLDTKRIEKILALREGGQVQRCHTLPHIGSYTVGQHSFDAVNLLLTLHPDPSLKLVKAVLWHDMAERWVGDTPAPVLRSNPEFKRLYEELEQKALERLDLNLGDLTEDELAWLKAVDRLEFVHWCFTQLSMGNQFVGVALGNAFKMLDEMENIPEPARLHLEELREGDYGRLGEI